MLPESAAPYRGPFFRLRGALRHYPIESGSVGGSSTGGSPGRVGGSWAGGESGISGTTGPLSGGPSIGRRPGRHKPQLFVSDGGPHVHHSAYPPSSPLRQSRQHRACSGGRRSQRAIPECAGRPGAPWIVLDPQSSFEARSQTLVCTPGHQASSRSNRATPGAAGFLTLSQVLDRPERYG
jgi:hypothetical protein